MTCKECIHYGVCGGFIPTDLDQDVFDYCREGRTDEIPDIEWRCNDFKPKSRYIELPCAVGDTVYFAGIFTGQIIENTIVGITVCEDDLIIHCSGEVWVSASQQLGKHAFLTKEEAEKALEEKQQ